MEIYEETTHSFIVRLWLEEVAQANQPATWRANITHVPSGSRQYFRDIDDIKTFILPYLEEMGAKPGLCYRIKRRLRRLKR